MTYNTKRTKKHCKRNRKTLKRSFKKRGGVGSVKNQRSRAKTSSTMKRKRKEHIYHKINTPSPTPYTRLHGKTEIIKKKRSPAYNNLKKVKGPFKPGEDTLLDNEIAEKRGMKLKK